MNDDRPTVLLVDDHPDIRDGLSILLEASGYRVVTAADGAEALQTLRAAGPVSAIVLDLVMPGMTGYQFRQEQLKDAQLSDIPLVVYSGVAEGSEHNRHLGAAAYLRKPIEIARLRAALARLRLHGKSSPN